MPPPTMIHTSNNDLKSTLRARREADLCQAKRKLKHRHQVPSSPVKPQQDSKQTISSPTPTPLSLSLSPLALLPDCTPSRGESSSNNTRRQILLQALQDASSIAQEQEAEEQKRHDGKASSWSHPVVINDKVAPRRWSLTHVPVLIQEQDPSSQEPRNEVDEPEARMIHPTEPRVEKERKKKDAEEIYVAPLLMDEKGKTKNEDDSIIIPDWDAMAKNRRRSSTTIAKGTPHPRLSKTKVVARDNAAVAVAVPPPPPLTMDEDEDDNEEEYSQPLAPVVQQQKEEAETSNKKTRDHQTTSSSSRRRWSSGTGGAKKASSQRCLTSKDKNNNLEWSSASAHHSSTRGSYYTPQTGVRKSLPVQDEKRDSIHSERSATLHSHASSSRASTVIVVPSEHSYHNYPKGSVHFGAVSVYLHAYLLGDNPSVSDPSGPPLTIAWKAHQAIRYASPDEYQQQEDYGERRRRRRRIPTDHSMDPSILSSPVDRSSRRLSVSKWTPKQRVDLILSSGSVTVQELAIAMVELDEQNGTSKKWTRVWERIWHSKQQQQHDNDETGARRRRRRSTSRESKRRNNSNKTAMSGESKRSSSSSNRKRLL